MRCTYCKKEVQAKDGFCEDCGYQLAEKKTSEEDDIEVDMKVEKIEEPEEILCNNCGQNNFLQANFCQNCGQKLDHREEKGDAEDKENERIRGYLLLPDQSEIQITSIHKLVGRMNLAKFTSSELINSLSRGHFTVFRTNNSFYVQDGMTSVQQKPSTNGTWLVRDGQKEKITGKGPFELSPGDEILVAELVTLKFQAE